MRRAGTPVELSPTEFKLLRYLMLNPNRVLSKAQILDHVWAYDFNGEAGIVESYISYLRRKVDVDGPAADPHQARRRLRAAPAAGGLTHRDATPDSRDATTDGRPRRAGARCRCERSWSASCWCCCWPRWPPPATACSVLLSGYLVEPDRRPADRDAPAAPESTARLPARLTQQDDDAASRRPASS